MFPFITQPEDNSPEPETDPSLSRTLRELRQEKVDLESQLSEMRQKFSDLKASKATETGFAPLASLFPLRRDAFGQAKSASQQLKIYRKDWTSLQDRFNRVNDTGFAYDLEQVLQKKAGRVRALEKEQIELRVRVEGNERKLIKLKGEKADFSSTAEMANAFAHVYLLRDQVAALERAAEQRIHLYQEADESLKKAQNRHKKMEQVAKEHGITLKVNTDQSAKAAYEAAKLKLARLERKGFFKEEQRVKELISEGKRLKALGEQMDLEIATKDAKIAEQRQFSRSARASPRTGRHRMFRDLSQQISQRF